MILWFMADGVRGQPVTMIDGKSIAATHAVIKPYVRATPIAGVSGADFGLSRALAESRADFVHVKRALGLAER